MEENSQLKNYYAAGIGEAKAYVYGLNNKIFYIFMHNALLSNINIDKKITNITVLKQESVLKMRLMNLMVKKIRLLNEEKSL